MKKIKMFFKDVVGEIRDPSDDSGKVLDTSRSLLCVAIILQVVLDLASIVSMIFNWIHTIEFAGGIDKLSSPDFRFQFFLWPLVKQVISVAIDTVFSIMCVKSVKKGKLISNKMFIAFLFASVLLPLIINIIRQHSAISILHSLIYGLFGALVLYNLFYEFKKAEIKEETIAHDNKTRIRNIIMLNFVMMLYFTVRILFIFITRFSDNMEYITYFYKYMSLETVWDYLFPLQNILFVVYAIPIGFILAFSFILDLRYRKHIKKAINVSFVIFIIVQVVFVVIYASSAYSIFYLAVFIILAGYSSKYKALKGMYKSLIVNAAAKIKTSCNNYLSFKEK